MILFLVIVLAILIGVPIALAAFIALLFVAMELWSHYDFKQHNRVHPNEPPL